MQTAQFPEGIPRREERVAQAYGNVFHQSSKAPSMKAGPTPADPQEQSDGRAPLPGGVEAGEERGGAAGAVGGVVHGSHTSEVQPPA